MAHQQSRHCDSALSPAKLTMSGLVSSRPQDMLDAGNMTAENMLKPCQADVIADVGRRRLSPQQSRTTLRPDKRQRAPPAGHRPQPVAARQICRKPRSIRNWRVLQPSCTAKVQSQCAPPPSRLLPAMCRPCRRTAAWCTITDHERQDLSAAIAHT